MKFVSSILSLPISAQSAAFAPTNSADVSAIASAYQVVSATATQLYAGTAYVTSVNGAPLSASRAGQAANASLASSAYYDGTGRLISSLPDSAAVSAIASSYAESAASGKQDSLTFDYDDDKISAINGSALAGQGGGGGSVVSPNGTILVTDGSSIEATNSAIGSSTVEQKFLNYAPSTSQINYWYSNVLIGGKSVSGASLMKLQALENIYNPTTVFTVSISGNPIGGGSEIVGTATASSYGSSMEFDFPLDPSWGFGTIWGSANPNTINLDTADANAIAFYSASTSSGVKELAWKDDIPSAVDIGVYEDAYHNKYISSIDSMQVSAKWAGSASDAAYAYTAVQDPNGRYLSALADKSSVPSGITSPNGTIIANGFNVEATNSAVTTTVVPGYATTVAGWEYQVSPDTPVVCTLPSANENSKLFFQLDYGGTITASAVYNGTTATATVEGGNTAVAMFDVPNATTVSLYGSWYRVMLGSASASAADYLAPGSIGELAWASALPTYSYDSENKISGINGSAIAGGAGGVDSATVSAIASSYAESAASGKLDSSASSSFYSTANESGFITGVDLSPYQTTADMSGYMPTSLSSDFQQVTGMSSYVPYSSIGYNTASAISGINGSALAGTTYSAGTGIDITDDVISVEAPVDIVAGPGIVIDNPDGNTLRVSTDANYETLLWEDSTGKLLSQGITLNESRLNFEMIRLYMGAQVGKSVISYDMPMYGPNRTQAFAIQPSMPFMDTAGTGFAINWEIALSATETSMSSVQALYWGKSNFGAANTASGTWTQGANNAGVPVVYKVIGIHRTASN